MTSAKMLRRKENLFKAVKKRSRFRLLRAFFYFICDLIFLPYRLFSNIFKGLYTSTSSLLSLRFGISGILGFLSGPAKLFTLVMAIWFIFNPYLLSEMEANTKELLVYILIASASLAVITSIYGCARSVMVCAFWFIAAYIVGNTVYKVKPSRKPLSVMLASAKGTLPEKLEFYDIPSQTLSSSEKELTDYLPNVNQWYGTIQECISSSLSSVSNNISQGTTNGISEIIKMSGLSGSDGVQTLQGSVSLNSGELPDEAFFPRPAKTKDFYRMRGTGGGVLDKINQMAGRANR